MGYRPITPDQWDEELRRDGIPAVVDLNQAAALLRCSQSTIRSYRDAGRLRSLWPAGSYRPIQFARLELCRFLAGAE